jgi:phosphomannomutase
MSQPLSLKIGPSGVRGVVGESLTPQLVTSFAAAFGTYCGAGPILIGTDTRPSGEMVKQAAIAGLLSVGCTPVDVAVVPRPALMLHVRESGAFGGISVGASHASPDANALQFIGPGGRALRANEAAELTDLYHQGLYPRVRAPEMSELRADATSVVRHVGAVAAAVDVVRVRARKFKVALDGRGPAGIAMPRLLAALGCEVVPVGTGGRLPPSSDPDAASSSLAALCALVRRQGADIGIAPDWDAAGLVIVDESGTPLGAEAAALLVVRRWLERGAGPVVVDVAASRVVDDIAGRAGCPVYRARVGEANVLEAMLERGAGVGVAGDGGVIVLPVNHCRDSFAAAAIILEAMAVAGASAGELRARAPRYALRSQRLLCPARDIAPSLRLVRTLFRGEHLDLTDGVKVEWPDRWLLARPSATEPAIQLTAEAATDAEAQALLNRVLEVLSPGA